MSHAQELKDVRKVNAAGVKLALRIANSIKKKAVDSFLKNEDPFEVKSILLNGYQDVLARAMKVSYLAGWKRVESEAFKQQLKLSEMSDLERTLEKLTSSDVVAELEAQLETRALRVLQDSTDEVEGKLRSVINQLIAEGATAKRGTQELGKAFDKLGLTPANPYQIENIFRTQTQLMYGAAKDHAEQSPEVQEILFGYKYVTVGDNRVRDEHAAMEGVVFEKGDPLIDTWYPPNGYSCRCLMIALFSRPPGRLRRPPADLPQVDPQFAFRPGHILAPPRGLGGLAIPTPPPTHASLDTGAYERATKDPALGAAGIRFKRGGEVQVSKPKNISMARAQLQKIQELRDAAVVTANAAKTLPKNSEERVKAELRVVHLVQQFERVVRYVKTFLD